MAFTESVGTQTDVSVLAKEAVRILQGHFPDASIGYYQRDQDLWKALAWSDDLPPEAVGVITAGVTSEHPVIAEVLAAQGAVFDYTYLRAAVVSPSSYWAVGSVPLTLGIEMCGLLSVGLRSTPDWNEQDQQVLRTVARGLNLALERSDQTRQLELERASLSAFAAFTELAGTETDVEVLIQQATRLLQQTRVVDVAYFGREGTVFQIKHASQDFPPKLLARSHQGFTLEQLPFDRALLKDGVALFVDNWNAEKDGVPETSVVTAVAYLPFFRAGEVSGMLNMSTRDRSRWTERDRGIFRAVGRSLALALERAEHAELLRGQNAELAAQARALEGMEKLSHDLALEGDRDALIRRTLELVLSLLPEGSGTFFERAASVWRVSVRVGEWHNDTFRVLSSLGLPVGQTPSFDQPFETGEPFFQDVYDPSLDVSPDLVSHVQTVATLPLIVNGEVEGILVVSLFERHRWSAADRALLTTTARSLGLVIERALGVAQLAEERRVLALTNEELEAFAYSASHDLRTPVRHVMSFADLTRGALATTPNEKASRYLDAVQQAAIRMTDLIDAMLLLSRAGRRAVMLKPVDLNVVVANIQNKSFQIEAKERVRRPPTLANPEGLRS